MSKFSMRASELEEQANEEGFTFEVLQGESDLCRDYIFAHIPILLLADEKFTQSFNEYISITKIIEAIKPEIVSEYLPNNVSVFNENYFSWINCYSSVNNKAFQSHIESICGIIKDFHELPESRQEQFYNELKYYIVNSYNKEAFIKLGQKNYNQVT